MSESNKWIEVISAINEKTQIGRIKWQSSENPVTLSLHEGNQIFGSYEIKPEGAAFTADYDNKVLRIYKFSNTDKGKGLLSLGAPKSIYFSLEILDTSGNVLLKVPESTGLDDLYKTIQYQAAGVDDLIKSLLS